MINRIRPDFLSIAIGFVVKLFSYWPAIGLRTLKPLANFFYVFRSRSGQICLQIHPAKPSPIYHGLLKVYSTS